MPTREDMNSAGQPFLALRREAEAPAVDKDEIIAQLRALVSSGCVKREAQAREISRLQESASALRRDLAQARELLNEIQTVAIE